MSGQRDALSQLRQAAQRLPRPLNGWFSTLNEEQRERLERIRRQK